MNYDIIRSQDNATIKYVRSLRQRSTRRTERAFVVEGIRAVEDGLLAGGSPRSLLVRADSDWIPEPQHEAITRWVDPRVFDKLADTASPQPLMAVFDLVELDPGARNEPLFVVVDGVQDPGNLGTLLRSAAGAGAAAVLLTSGSVDPYNPKVVRAGMGAHFRIPIQELTDRWINDIESACGVRALAEAGGEMEYTDLDWTGAVALIVGSEAHGPSDVGSALANATVRITLEGGVESLNAGVAGSVLLFEAARQRRVR